MAWAASFNQPIGISAHREEPTPGNRQCGYCEVYGNQSVQAFIIEIPIAELKELQDKTLYLDRWRPGFLRLPGTGGGSLVMWVPHSSEGGHIDLAVVLNVSR